MLNFIQTRLDTKIRRATFLAGLTILLLLAISFIVVLVADGKSNFEIITSLQGQNKLNDENLSTLIQQGLFINFKSSFWHRTMTFTYLSNFAIGLALTFYSLFMNKKGLNNFVVWSSIYIFVTFLIFWSLVFPGLFKSGVYKPDRLIASLITHLINPLIAIIFIVLNRKKLVYTHKWIIASIIPMFIYYFFAMIIYFNALPTSHLLAKSVTDLEVWKLQDKLGLTIYGFLNFEYPLFYHGDSTALKVVFNLIIVLVGVALPIGIGYLWKLVCLKK
ncbi:MAGa3780 family membrane protein [Mycoplasma buteonis]|uniref:MAGa3780 family membrane protein n=1 Tax=Mycoplasma buteonis TaxID=171280 RepID=UPI00055F5F20|nr:hypothetical protein [Mycoplasma buteonis]